VDFEEKVHQRKTVSRVLSIQMKDVPAYPGPDHTSVNLRKVCRQVHSHELESFECVKYD